MEGAPQVTELQTAQKNRPRALTFPLPHQRHLEPSRLSPQTPLCSAPGSAVKVSDCMHLSSEACMHFHTADGDGHAMLILESEAQ